MMQEGNRNLMKILIVTLKSWNIRNAENMILKYKNEHDFFIISRKEEFTVEFIEKIKPDFIFFPHWSYIIPSNIYENNICVVFHMTDLPFGRGGSPLQNLIVRGYQQTKISAIRVTKEIDAGPIYMKEELSLEGSAEQIFKRASDIVFEKMIPEFLKKDLIPQEQKGRVECFKRRLPEESELKEEMEMDIIYNYIRMLDAEGYPNAFIKFGNKTIKFKNAIFKQNKITAEVEVIEE